jgi:hypothetical protein
MHGSPQAEMSTTVDTRAACSAWASSTSSAMMSAIMAWLVPPGSRSSSGTSSRTSVRQRPVVLSNSPVSSRSGRSRGHQAASA